ncbi:MAG TPA: energy transducer TonB [Terriglobales bacterium]|nr:energy transducer TonB [Terriglobales bacterium]
MKGRHSLVAVVLCLECLSIAQDTPRPDKVAPPLAIYMVNPDIPKSRQSKNAHGELILKATIGRDGGVKDVTVIAGDTVLANAAAAAVNHWRYLPAQQNGSAIESTQNISIKYKLGKHVSRPQEPTSTVERCPHDDLLAAITTGRLFPAGEKGVVPPKALEAPDPQYSEAARLEKVQGSMDLGVVVSKEGIPQDVWVIRPIGYGLDEQALQVLKHWKFVPANKNGEPVPVVISVEVSFALSNGDEPEFDFGIANQGAPGQTRPNSPK